MVGMIDDLLDRAGEAFDRRIRLGVTGLSQAGKSVFITSLLHNLLHPGHLPLLGAAAEGRMEAAILRPQPDDDVPRFDFERAVGRITGRDGRPPCWPESTRSISEVRVSIRFTPKGLLRRRLGDAVLHLDLFDYPGEWLLDLPLLGIDYEAWSRDAFALAETGTRAALSAAWRDYVGGLDPAAPEDEAVAIRAAELYTAYLRACRAHPMPLSRVQPGRFLLPGDLAGSPVLTFAPLPPGPEQRAPRRSLRRLMQARFEAYQRKVVRPFFEEHFARLDRQIVLVDLLGHLAAGQESLGDLGAALDGTLECFRVGGPRWLRPFVGRRIDRVLFAATKADHLPRQDHEGLAALLRGLLYDRMNRIAFKGAAIETMALAAVRSTREVEIRRDGRVLTGVAGLPAEGGDALAVLPGRLPPRLEEATGDGSFRALSFLPPPGLGRDGKGLPNLRMDRTLEFLIGDMLV